MTTGRTDLDLALEYLTGRRDYSGSVVTTVFDLSEAEVRDAREAIARLLASDRPPRELLEVLSALFASEDSYFSGGRTLVLKNRKRGPLHDAAKDFEIVARVKLKQRAGLRLEVAFEEVAAEIGMTDNGVRDAWKRNPRIRAAIFRGKGGE